ncbi:hypothetical protein T190_12090 [Sinorhizobium meliloti CCBAU 01290]|nr:hypothetical protein T190_12090 [Sinorhizobium meliloti CCBAU 01290]
MTDLIGFYSDHKIAAPLAIAQRSAKFKPFAAEIARRGILQISTCARLEFYGEKSVLEDIDGKPFFGFSYGRVEGAIAIAVVSHDCSRRSLQILGEGFISDQLMQAIESGDPNLSIFKLARLAVDLGSAARKRQEFFAEFDYVQIVEDIIADRFSDKAPLDRIYIIGAGMLGQELIRGNVGERFRSTVVITRNPKKLRKRLNTGPKTNVTFMRPSEVGRTREPGSMVVIATTDVDNKYKAILQETLLRLGPRIILDLSSIPVLTREAIGQLDYVNMYGDEFLRFIEQNNQRLAPKLPLVVSDIKAALGAAV